MCEKVHVVAAVQLQLSFPSSGSVHLFSETSLSPSRPGWLLSKSQGSSWLCFTKVGITNINHHIQLCSVCLVLNSGLYPCMTRIVPTELCSWSQVSLSTIKSPQKNLLNLCYFKRCLFILNWKYTRISNLAPLECYTVKFSFLGTHMLLKCIFTSITMCGVCSKVSRFSHDSSLVQQNIRTF